MAQQTSGNTRGAIPTRLGRRGLADPGMIEKAEDPKQALLRLLPFLKSYRLMLVAIIGMVLLYTITGLVGPYLTGVAIDDFIAVKDAAGLGRIALIMLVDLSDQQRLADRRQLADGDGLAGRPATDAGRPL